MGQLLIWCNSTDPIFSQFPRWDCRPSDIEPITGACSFDRRNDEAGAGGIQAYLRPRNTIFVPKTAWEEGMTQRTAGTYCNNNDRTRGRDGNRRFSLQ